MLKLPPRSQTRRTVSATELRQKLTHVIKVVTAEEHAVVVTVGTRPRIVVADFHYFEELCWLAERGQ